MTLRIASLRIDPVAGALDGQRVRSREPLLELGEGVEPAVAWRGPAVLENENRGGAARVEAGDELGPERLDARIAHVLEEVEVVDEARGLPEAQAQQRVNATGGGVHHLHGGARGDEG